MQCERAALHHVAHPSSPPPSPLASSELSGHCAMLWLFPKHCFPSHTKEQQNWWDELPCCLQHTAEVWDGFSCQDPRAGFFTSTVSRAHQPPSSPANAKVRGAFISLLSTEHGCLLGKGASLLSRANVIDEASLQAPAMCGQDQFLFYLWFSLGREILTASAGQRGSDMHRCLCSTRCGANSAFVKSCSGASSQSSILN